MTGRNVLRLNLEHPERDRTLQLWRWAEMDGAMLRFTLVLFLLLASSVAHAEKRVALVIGNSGYKHAGVLSNPMNDAADMAGILKQKGFLVIEGQDLDKSTFVSKVEEFRRAIVSAEIAVFFYAGHGMQVAGRNFLVPTDAELATPAALDSRADAGKRRFTTR